jgi:DNA polymerase-4
VASNKFLAKVASDMNKPDGLTVVPEDEAGVLAFLGRLPVTKLWGIGKVSGERLHRAGIRTIAQLQMMDTAALAQYFGVAGAKDIWALCRGIDDRPVVTEWAEKSVSGEHTFDQDCAEIERVRQVLLEQVERVGRRLRSAGKAGKIVQIKVRFSDFRTITRQVSLPVPIDSDRLLRDAAYALLDRENIHRPVRLIGVGVTGLAEGAGEVGQGQLLLPDLNPVWQDGRNAALDRAVDALRETFGKGAIKRGNWKKPLD